jgi:hypothetical protein
VRLASLANPWYPRHLRRAASIVAMLIFFICIIASKARLASPPLPTIAFQQRSVFSDCPSRMAPDQGYSSGRSPSQVAHRLVPYRDQS